MKNNITLLGNGSWATAIAKLLTDNNSNIKLVWYFRNTEDADFFTENLRNKNYLTTLKFDKSKLEITTDINYAVKVSETIFIAIPSAFINNELSKLQITLENKNIISGVKGIIPISNLLVSEYLKNNFNVDYNLLSILAGPCHSEEIAMEKLSYLTIASQDLYKAEFVATLLETNYLKTSISNDIFGNEYSSVLKNIFALASGICKGLGYGDNFQAVLISNAVSELTRFIDTVYPFERNIKKSAYLGDLLVTAYSNFSRNRTFGLMIGQGYSIQTAKLETNMIAEGYFAVKSLFEINKKYNINLPILNAVYNILYNNAPPAFEIKLLTDKIR